MSWIRFQVFTIILVSYFASSLAGSFASQLGSPCTKDRHCKVDNSHCVNGVCTCKHYHAQLGTSACLESKLLGRDCVVEEQCSLRVANSTCFDGHCHCSPGFIRFRKHTCLGPAKPGDVCYSDDHCQLYSKTSHCNFLIPKLFGKCVCDGEGDCGAGESTKPTNSTSEKPTNSTSEKPTNSTSEKPTNSTSETKPTTDKTSSTESTTTESSNDGEGEMKPGEDAEMKPLKAYPFVDPFQHQKEHLHEPTATKTPESDVTTVTEEGVTEVTSVVEDAATESLAASMSPEGSKYRVEASDTSGTVVNWSQVTAVSLGYPCRSDLECQKRDNHSRCLNGVCDCVLKTNASKPCSRRNTGCGPETFQCRESGACISWFFVCDGRPDCSDKSDEECEGPKCPNSSFQCGPNGPCLSQAVICDGKKNCPNGEDERFCSPDQRNSTSGCPENSLQCANGQCLPKFEFCNAIPKCTDGSDESPLLCSSHGTGKKATNRKKKEHCPFECGNGRCRSTAIVCSGRDGCGDNSDEAQCSVCRCPAN